MIRENTAKQIKVNKLESKSANQNPCRFINPGKKKNIGNVGITYQKV